MNAKKAKALRKYLRPLGWAWNDKQYLPVQTYQRTYSLPIRLDPRCGRANYRAFKKDMAHAGR